MDVIDPRIERYVEELSAPHEDLLAELSAETATELGMTQMLTGPVAGRFLELLALGHDVLQLALDGRLARESLPREILPVRLHRVACLAVELVDLLLHRGVLQLEPLLRRRHVGDAALHVLQLAQLLLVGVVERLVRVLGAIERLGGLRPEDQAQA